MSLDARGHTELAQQDRALAADVLTHLDAQIESARGAARGRARAGRGDPRARRADGRAPGGDPARRDGPQALLEEERSSLLARSGQRLGVPAESVTLALLGTLMDDARAERANARSAELRGLLHELQREHSCNRALMQIELGFLDHLMGMLSLDGVNGYDTHGSSTPITRSRPHGALHVLDLQRLNSMSIPTLQGLQTALSGLLAEQTALDTTGNNIANANTEGYSRETAVLRAQPAARRSPRSRPTPARARSSAPASASQTITRIRNTYLDAQYRAQNSALSAASTQAEVLEQAQSRLQRTLQRGHRQPAVDLLDRVEQPRRLAHRRTGEAAKEGVVAAGEQLANTFNELSAQLSTISAQATEQYNALAGPSGEVEQLANQIAQLNGQIKLAEEAGQPPNEMLDRRDQLLDKLSALAQRHVTEETDHTDTVSFGEAAEPLVEGTNVNWPQTITEAAGGELGALLDLTGPKGALTGLQTGLDGVAETLAATVNAQLTTPFFSGTTAATLAVAVTPAEVQASGTGAGGQQRSGACESPALRGGAAEQDYATLVEEVGSDVQDAKDEQTNLQTTVTAINDQRQSVSGVSLDEEMTNLITFQRGYQASARTMTAMDEMLETLIEHTGVVGL